MKDETVSQQVDALSQRVNALIQRAQIEPQQSELFAQAIKELIIVIEELQVHQEELHQQNQELTTAREAVETEQQRYQELFDFAPDGYLVTETSGIVREVNRAASALLNVPRDRLVGTPLALFVPVAQHSAFRHQMLRLPQIGRLQEWVICLQPRDRKSFDAALTVTAVYDWEGKVVGLRWLLRDISDRKQLEEAQLRAKLVELANRDLQQEIARRQQLETQLRQQTEALVQANNLKDEFLAIVSHELRSPLNAMLGWSQVLRNRQLDAATTARALETIERNARLQVQLIEDLLDISRIVKGKLHLKVQPVNLVTVIEAAIHTMQPAIAAKQLDMQTVLDTPARLVSGDLERLQQVIWNLLSNAIKFTSPHGRIDIRLDYDSSNAIITISDTGRGIHPDFLPYVFENFRQAERVTTRFHGGLGLGLTIVRHLVEIHGGTVQADSPGEGQGATFTVRLPFTVVDTENESAAPSVPEAADLSLKDLAVLVVDDEADVRELLMFVLQGAGAIVTAAASVNEAIQMINQAKPDVLISDIGMPEQDGYSLIRQVRALEEQATHLDGNGAMLRAIALTAYTREEDRNQALTAGFQAHLSKPIQPAELVAAVASQATEINDRLLK